MLRPYWLASAELAVLILLGVTILLLTPSLSSQRALIVVALMTVLLLTTEAYLLLAHGIWVQLVTATLFTIMGIGSVHVLGSVKRSPNNFVAGAAEKVLPSALADIDELDLAFSVLRQLPATEETKERLYAIAVTHGKNKEFAKAERVLAHLDSIDSAYRDVAKKLKLLSGARNKTDEQDADGPEEPSAEEVAKDKVAGRTLGRYVLEKTLGHGAMATVYLGVDPNINRKVAIKTMALAKEFSEADLDAAKAQFRREAESAGRLNHPNIIAIYDSGEDANVAYLAMEYFSGKALNHYAQADNLLPPKWVLELTARAAEALHYAHGQNVVHRDIKPANLMYDAASDTMKITDFGIARLTDTSRTKTGIILGTPSYMSPEQLAASAVTGSSDLYSLGITMYQLLTGTTPFRSDSIPKLMDKIMNDKHKPLSSVRDDLPIEIETVLDKMLAKKPEDRFPNGRAVALALRDCIGSIES
jgi:serine/threonine-protein kinase